MKKIIYSIVLIGMLGGSVMAMQFQSGDKMTLPDGRRVEFVSTNRPTSTAGLEFIVGTGWVKVLGNGQQDNQEKTSLTSKLTNDILSRGLAILPILLLKDEAVSSQKSGYVEVEPIVRNLLSNGVWENLKTIPGFLLSSLLDDSWSEDESGLAKAAVNLFVGKIGSKHKEETLSSIDDFVDDLNLKGLYIDPVCVSKILNGAGDAFDKAAGLKATGRNSQQRRMTAPRRAQVTQEERGLIEAILGKKPDEDTLKLYKNEAIKSGISVVDYVSGICE
ncbi:hypothetical protein KKA53_04575 [Candidatus Dependentiae bacterium]|nr:hypothetical protein [Candidatus Dependentiae bacterium]